MWLTGLSPSLTVFGIAVALDLLLGDPEQWPHPVRWIGGLIDAVDQRRQQWGAYHHVTGALLAVGLTALTTVTAILFIFLGNQLHPILGSWVGAVLLFFCVSGRQLYTRVKSVTNLVLSGNQSDARDQLSGLVGRETEQMDDPDISQALVETTAEGYLDGVVSPCFWFVVAGVPGAVAYRTINTLDAMIGYRSDLYEQFGTVAARLDDLVNFIPARLSILLIAVAAGLVGRSPFSVLHIGFRDRLNHDSPNAGHPEAAFAGALGVRLGGPVTYGHGTFDRPHLAASQPLPGVSAITSALLLYGSCCLVAVAATAGYLVV